MAGFPLSAARSERRSIVKNSIKIALIALAMSGGSIIASQPALADHVVVTFDPGVVAYGYSDGYWDRYHAWHRWRRHEDMIAYREAYHDHYYEWRHDRDRDHGWHEQERWWDRH
jgi:hypothetical protein